MSKRPLQNIDASKNAKKPREDPTLRRPQQNPVFNNQNIAAQKATEIVTINDSDDDDELCLVSQQIEESVKVNPGIHAFEFVDDVGYSQFKLNPSCSTQIIPKNYHIDMGSQSSQKENNHQPNKSSIDKMFLKPPLPRPSEPPKQILTSRPTENQSESGLGKISIDLKEKNQQLAGEVSTLRTMNTKLSSDLSNLKSKYQKDINDVSRQGQEKQEKLRREIKKLEDQLQFNDMNNSMHGTRRAPVDIEMKTFPPTDIPCTIVHAQLNIPRDFYDVEPSPDVMDQNSAKSKINFIAFQAWVAQIQTEVSRSGIISDSVVREMFIKVCEIVKEIEKEFSDFVTSFYMTLNKKDTFAKYASGMAIPLFRPILIDEHFSITKSGKLFQDELAHIPRRILALVAILCRSSKALAKRLLTEKVKYEDDPTKQKTIVEILTKILQNKVVKSDRFFNLEGFVMSAAHVLSSISIHADSSNNLQLFDLFKNILLCKHDNPFVVLNCTEFLYEFINQTNDVAVFKPLLCSIGKFTIPTNHTKLRMIFCPDGICTFRLLTMYLLTSFTQSRPLNKTEIKYLQNTSFFLNSMTIRMLGLDPTAFIDETTKEKICVCYHNLINAIVLLAHMSTKQRCQNNHVLFNAMTFTTITALHEIFTRLDDYMEFPIQNLFFANYLEAFCLRVKNSKLIQWINYFKIGPKFKIISEPHVQIAAGSQRDEVVESEESKEQLKKIKEELKQMLITNDDDDYL